MAQIMNYDHPRWREFLDRLEGPGGCDFTGEYDIDGNIIVDTVTWKCAGGHDKSKAIALLEEIGNIDIPATIAFFEAHGGHCDCEILFNVAH